MSVYFVLNLFSFIQSSTLFKRFHSFQQQKKHIKLQSRRSNVDRKIITNKQIKLNHLGHCNIDNDKTNLGFRPMQMFVKLFTSKSLPGIQAFFISKHKLFFFKSLYTVTKIVFVCISKSKTDLNLKIQ